MTVPWNPWRWIEHFLTKWLDWWFPRGEAWQYAFYRCFACRRIVTWVHIQHGGCPCRESSRISPAMLTRAEKARILLLPWTL